jgi:hypothetical protein
MGTPFPWAAKAGSGVLAAVGPAKLDKKMAAIMEKRIKFMIQPLSLSG